MKRLEASTVMIKKIGFSNEILNELYDALNQSREILRKYSEMSSSFPSSIRNKISSLSMQSDLLLLQFNELYLHVASIIEKVRKSKVTGRKVTIKPKERKMAKEKLEFLKVNVSAFIREVEELIKSIRDYYKYPPLPAV